MTLEQYLSVAHLWYADKEGNFNPFESQNSQLEFLDLQKQINDHHEYDGKVADDGFIDYAQDNINTIEPEEEKERHDQRFDPEALRLE